MPPIRNNASSFGCASPLFQTPWSAEYDGRKLEEVVTLVATKDGRMYTISEPVPTITVPVLL